MTKLAYLDCPTGLAGDMCLGALVHAGVPLDYLVEKLELLGISHEYRLWEEQVHRNGQQATKVHVDLLKAPIEHKHFHEGRPDPQPLALVSTRLDQTSSEKTAHPHAARHLPEIEHLIRAAGLPKRAEVWSLAVFRQLAEAEGAVHGIAPTQVHFHEVGATDAIVDIVGTCLGLDWLEIDQLYCSALPTGGGTVLAAHGRLSVPTPAVLKLWEMRQVSIYSNGIERELVTPTGAAIATTLATEFGPPPAMTLQQVGLGAGSRNLPIPNILRLWVGEGEHREGGSQQKEKSRSKSASGTLEAVLNSVSAQKQAMPSLSDPSQEAIVVLETQIDDLSPQAIGYVFETLFAAGAVDVFTQAIGMKKSRPGTLLSVVCPPEQVQACEAVLFRETTTLGIRRSTQWRTVLYREIQTVKLDYGTVQVKVARQEKEGAIINVQPEYEDCARLARASNLPWREVHRLALYKWHLQLEAEAIQEPS